MSCCCDTYEHPLLGALMGQLSQPAMKKGARFAYGYNTGYTTGPFEASEIAALTNGAGLTEGARSWVVAGTLSYFIAVEGRSAKDWASGTDLKDAITQLIISNDYSIDLSSIQFQFEPAQGTTSPPVIYTGPPGSPGVPKNQPDPNKKSFWEEIAEELDVTKDTAQIVTFGGVALLLILLMKR